MNEVFGTQLCLEVFGGERNISTQKALNKNVSIYSTLVWDERWGAMADHLSTLFLLSRCVLLSFPDYVVGPGAL